MQKRLAALLSCSLIFLLGFTGCCDKACKKASPAPSAAKSMSKKAPCKTCTKDSCKNKNTCDKPAKVASLYNQNSNLNNQLPDISDEAFSQLTFIDEHAIADFDIPAMAYDTSDFNIFDTDDKKALTEEIDQLVSLWKAQDESSNPHDLRVDFRTLYLDADKSIIAPSEAPADRQIAQGAEPLAQEPRTALMDDLPKDENAVKIAAMSKQAIIDLDDDSDRSIITEDSTTKHAQLIA